MSVHAGSMFKDLNPDFSVSLCSVIIFLNELINHRDAEKNWETTHTRWR
jgi:hypothetical protein